MSYYSLSLFSVFTLGEYLLTESGLIGCMTVVGLFISPSSGTAVAGGTYSTTLIPTRDPGPKDWASMVIKLTKVSKEEIIINFVRLK